MVEMIELIPLSAHMLALLCYLLTLIQEGAKNPLSSKEFLAFAAYCLLTVHSTIQLLTTPLIEGLIA